MPYLELVYNITFGFIRMVLGVTPPLVGLVVHGIGALADVLWVSIGLTLGMLVIFNRADLDLEGRNLVLRARAVPFIWGVATLVILMLVGVSIKISLL